MDTQDQDSVKGGEGAPSKPGRRRFASTGIKATGVILTVASPPGMAAVCKSASALMSGSLKSSPGDHALVCSGLSPGYWKNWPDSWPAGIQPVATQWQPATTFASVFPNGDTILYQNGTLMGVLVSHEKGQDPHNLGAHIVAAYLNVMSNKINYLTVESLKSMWHDLFTYGYYSPAPNTRWNREKVARYLASTEH